MVVNSTFKTKTALAVEALREAIVRGDIRAGEHLSVAALARLFGMSATPVREAVRVLQAQGFVDQEPHRRISVASLSFAEAEEVYAVRSFLEGFATALAVPRLTNEDFGQLETLQEDMNRAQVSDDLDALQKANTAWHFYIYDRAESKFTVDFIRRLWTVVRWESLYILPGRVERSIVEHRAVLEAIRAYDATRANHLMCDHIEGAGRAVIEQHDVLQREAWKAMSRRGRHVGSAPK